MAGRTTAASIVADADAVDAVETGYVISCSSGW